MFKTPASENLLIDAFADVDTASQRVLCTSLGRAQFAGAVAESSPTASVQCVFPDRFATEESRELHADVEANLQILCQPDLPEIEADLVVIPVTSFGEAELTRDWLQQGYQRLRTHGRFFSATNNGQDTWLHTELRKLFGKVTRQPMRRGVLYSAVKDGPLKKTRNFSCEFAFRDRGRLIHAFSRPGVFSHRRLDTGARALMEIMEIRDGDRVFDIGCGTGIVSFAAAKRAKDVQVYSVDSNARAVECTQHGADMNGLQNITAAINADAKCDRPGTYDVVVTNPPYYSRGRLWEMFIRGAVQALKPDGRLYVVSKRPNWYFERLEFDFEKITSVTNRSYNVITGEGLRHRSAPPTESPASSGEIAARTENPGSPLAENR